jgi:hypothetical protein
VELTREINSLFSAPHGWHVVALHSIWHDWTSHPRQTDPRLGTISAWFHRRTLPHCPRFKCAFSHRYHQRSPCSPSGLLRDHGFLPHLEPDGHGHGYGFGGCRCPCMSIAAYFPQRQRRARCCQGFFPEWHLCLSRHPPLPRPLLARTAGRLLSPSARSPMVT